MSPDTIVRLLVPLGLLVLCLASVEAGKKDLLFLNFNEDDAESEARNVRAEARKHFFKAQDAMEKLLEAEQHDDVDGYDENLLKMRSENEIWQELGTQYDQLRDLVEAKIRHGAPDIDGFEKRTNKGVLASLVDLATGRVQA